MACAVWLSLAVGPGLASVSCSGGVACARARCGAQLGVRWLCGALWGVLVGLWDCCSTARWARGGADRDLDWQAYLGLGWLGVCCSAVRA